ncbi:MAG: hypothetical protein ACOY93_08640 [Bacillota bacterium]
MIWILAVHLVPILLLGLTARGLPAGLTGELDWAHRAAANDGRPAPRPGGPPGPTVTDDRSVTRPWQTEYG